MPDSAQGPPQQPGRRRSSSGGEPHRPGVTLVLGGGGFKGLAHVGVLAVLQREGIAVERIVGTSAGALIGAMYCQTGDAEAVAARAVPFVASDGLAGNLPRFTRPPRGAPHRSLFTRLLSGIRRQVAFERMYRHRSAFGHAALRYIIRNLVDRGTLEHLPVPLVIGALDLVKGEEVLLTEGDLLTAVIASSAVPGFFPPVEHAGTLLCDAGLVDNLPTRAARELGAERVVAVDISGGLPPSSPESGGMEVLFRAQEISTRLSNRRRAELADVILQPDLGGRSWLDARRPEELVAAGVLAAEAGLSELRALVATRATDDDEARSDPALQRD